MAIADTGVSESRVRILLLQGSNATALMHHFRHRTVIVGVIFLDQNHLTNTRPLRGYPSLSDRYSAAYPVRDLSSARRTLRRTGQSMLVWPFQLRRLLCVNAES